MGTILELHPNRPLMEIRLANLKLLLDVFKTKVALAKKLEMSSAQLGQLLAPDKQYFRPVGDALARAIERKCCLEPYALDAKHGVSDQSTMESLDGVLDSSLRPIQQAALDSLKNAIKAGKVSDADCVALMVRWVDGV